MLCQYFILVVSLMNKTIIILGMLLKNYTGKIQFHFHLIVSKKVSPSYE